MNIDRVAVKIWDRSSAWPEASRLTRAQVWEQLSLQLRHPVGFQVWFQLRDKVRDCIRKEIGNGS